MYNTRGHSIKKILSSAEISVSVEDNNPIYISRYYDYMFNKMLDKYKEMRAKKLNNQYVRTFKNHEIDIICKTTSNCNQNCFYCFDKSNKTRNIIIDFEKILPFFIKCCDEFIKINWIWHGGEVTLIDKQLFEEWNYQLTTLALQHMCELNLSLQTNGSNLDNDWLGICYKYNISIGISDDTINSELSRRYKLDDALLCKMNDKTSIINRFNINNLKEIALENNRQEINNYKLNFVRGRDDSSAAIFLGDIDYAIDKYIEYALWYINSDIKATDMTLLSFILMSIDYVPVICNQGNCLDTSNIICVNFDTDIYKCDSTYNKQLFICHIDEYEGFKTIENKLIEFRRNLEEIYNRCSSCELSESCSRGCFNDIIYNNKKDDFYCALMKKLMPILRDRLMDLSPEEFCVINTNVKKCLLDNHYLPQSYLNKIAWRDDDIY